jgi:glycosylphosphatidylinositol transamidase (GPIT) subunit GPI8
MRNKIHYMLIALACTLCVNTGTYAQGEKPNILVIWGDDIGQSNISAYTMGLVILIELQMKVRFLRTIMQNRVVLQDVRRL